MTWVIYIYMITVAYLLGEAENKAWNLIEIKVKKNKTKKMVLKSYLTLNYNCSVEQKKLLKY